MLPTGEASSTPVRAALLPPDDKFRDPVVDYEMGGIHLNDPSQGLRVQQWVCYVLGESVFVSTVDGEDVTELFQAKPTELSLTFDQNMRATVAYVLNDICYLFWFDPVYGTMVTTGFSGLYSPFLTMDDKRTAFVSDSDILFVYLRENGCYYRLQRERYRIEHMLREEIPEGTSRIIAAGMNRQGRIQVNIEALY